MVCVTTFVVTAYMEDLMVSNEESWDDIEDLEELLADIERDELSGEPPMTLDEFMEKLEAMVREYGCTD